MTDRENELIERLKGKNQFKPCLYPYDIFAPPISYKEFMEIMRKGRESDKVSTVIFDEFTELKCDRMPKFVWGMNPTKDHWVTEYLKDNDNERIQRTK